MRLQTLTLLCALFPLLAQCAQPDVKEIIRRSVEANQRDFKAVNKYNNKERDRTPGGGSKTYQITMIEGTPYQRLIAVNGKPLPADQQSAEEKKEQQAIQQRHSESSGDRQKRIQKYERGRTRDNTMMQQLTEAFNFTLVGQHKVRGYTVYVLKATPKPGYNPPNMDSEVLPGMQGELWIDEKSFQWVKVTAQVIRPVSIAGFLARVEPGTRFELEKAPVGDGTIWFPSHFAEKANAKVLGVFSHNSFEDDTFWDYQPAK
jgi:hypothetical protein